MNDDTGNAERPPTGAEGRSPFHHRKRPEGAASSLAAATAEPEVRRVPLGDAGLYAVVDAADYETVSAYRWHIHRTRTPGLFYVQANVGTFPNRATIKMHRLIMGTLSRVDQIDHRDGDGLNNRRSNLRVATGSQNGGNTRKRAGTASPYKGVTWHVRKQWQARIGVGGGRRHLGWFADAETAARAYDEAAREVFGEFAAVNFPAPGERSAAPPSRVEAPPRVTSSRYRGVAFDRGTGKWRATIMVAGRTRSLGRYADEVDAARAYDAAAVEAWGEFARPNFPAEVAG